MATTRSTFRLLPVLGAALLGMALSSSASGEEGGFALVETPAPQGAQLVDEGPQPTPDFTEQAAPEGEDLGSGMASWYGPKFAGRRTASGEVFDPAEMTAAHRSLPFGSKVRVTNARTGRSVVVRINDRGPFVRSRVIDVSQAAARELGLIGPGRGEVSLTLLEG